MMKISKYIFALCGVSLALSACHKDNGNGNHPHLKDAIFTASAEQIDGKSFLWDKTDDITVLSADGQKSCQYTFSGTDKSGKAEFNAGAKPDFGGNTSYISTYPASVFSTEGGAAHFVWPASQNCCPDNADRYFSPMLGTGSISGTTLSEAAMTHLGGILEIDVTTSGAGAVVSKIMVSAKENLAGPFEAQLDSEGNRIAILMDGAAASVTIGVADKDGKALNLASGKQYPCRLALPVSPKVNADGYTSVSVTFYDGSGNRISTADIDGAVKITRGQVTKVSARVDSMSPFSDGVFSVSGSVKVHFATGNLYVDTTQDPVSVGFETDNTRVILDRNPDHVATFFWTKNFAASYAKDYSDDDRSASDVLFTNDGSLSFFDVQWRTLTADEWHYLLYERTMKNDGVRRFYCYDEGLYIYPDDFDGKDESGAVALPYYAVYGNLRHGFYWTATPFVRTKSNIGDEPLSDKDQAVSLQFNPNGEDPDKSVYVDNIAVRNHPRPIRLVTEISK